MTEEYWPLVPREHYLEKVVPALNIRPIAEDLCAFTGLDMETVRQRCDQSFDIMQTEWLTKDPKIEDEEVSGIYRKTKGGYLYAWAFGDRMRYSKYELLRPWLKGKTLLDYGTAIGCLPLFAERLDGFRATGADIDSPHFQFAQYRFAKYGSCKAINLDRDTLPKNHFDTILVLDVLEHIVHWRKALGQMAQAATQEGRIVTMVSYALYPDGSLHISDRTGLTPDALEGHMYQLGFIKIDETGLLNIYERPIS